MAIVKTASFELAAYIRGDPNSRKLALVLPGKLDTKDYAHMISHVNRLTDLGFYALSFDPPGTWESPGDISLYTMTNYLKSIDELINHFGNKPTLTLGHSRGGSMAIISGSRNKNIFAFISVMSSLSRKGFPKTIGTDQEAQGFVVSKRDLPPGGGKEVKEFRLPPSFFEDEANYTLTDKIASSTKPKLFILGKKDTIVSSEIIKETYNQFAEPKELYEVDYNHDYRFSQNIIDEINRKIEEFLKHHSLL